jgi:glycogen operon protein
LSWSCGVEGPTEDPEILALRRRQARNFIAILMLSQGVPMLHAGDELLQSKRGNNNSYCQNNEISWLDWGLLEHNCGMRDFVRAMIAFRQRHPTLHRGRFLTGEPEPEQGLPDITWYGLGLERPDWEDPQGRVLAFTLAGTTAEEPPLHVLLNMDEVPHSFAVPALENWSWFLVVDTGRERAMIQQPSEAPAMARQMDVGARSVMVLEGRTV